VFVAALVAALCAWLAVALAPRVPIGTRAPVRAAEEHALAD
jgi:hypothetical protein